MGRERQKKKNRSSISKATRKPKSKKRILNNPIIAANWDKSQTLAQNYRRLGLTARLNKSTGGTEKKAGDVERHDGAAEENGLRIVSGTVKPSDTIDVQEAKIERDPVTGNILRVIDTENARAKRRRLNDPLNDLDSGSDSSHDDTFDQHGPVYPTDGAAVAQPKTAVVQRLEQESQRPEKKYIRKLSESERVLVEQLVRKHGDDYGRMARDMEVNYMQRSAGDLKRRVKKWKDAGGEIE